MPVSSQEINDVQKVPGISNVEYDEPLLCFHIGEHSYSITVPDRYPNATAVYYGPEDSGELRPGCLADMVRQLLDDRGKQPEHEHNSACAVGEDDSSMSRETTMETQDGDLMARQDSSGVIGTELESDVQKLRARGDVFNVTMRGYSGGLTYIGWQMQTRSLVSATVASAWGIDTSAPVEVLVKTLAHYTDAPHPPTVEMYQHGIKFPFGQQMSRILNSHLRQFWPRSFPTGRVPDDADSAAQDVKQPPNLSAETVRLTTSQNTVATKLSEMGFATDVARRAAINSVCIDDALDFINRGSAAAAPALPSAHQNDSSEAGKIFSDPDATRYDSRKDPNKQCLLVTKKGLLSHVVDVIVKRTSSISKYCVLCDQPHLFATNMLRPAVCSRDICVFQFQELHLGSDSAESVATDAGVIDLLLTIFRCAALSDRAKNILQPFPSVAHPKDRKRLVMDPAKPDFDVVKTVLKSFPTTREVVRCNDLAQLKEALERTEPLAYPLLEWVIASNRSHLIQMDQAAWIPKMDTPHQFLLLTAPPEKESVFRERKAKHGTRFAFHGSRAENWHGILRNGLKNMSGSVNQVNGAVHGKGVYFAPCASSSLGYSGAGTSGKKSSSSGGEEFLGDDMICLALCEIINDGCIKEHGWCWTVEEESNIMTRFFFVYTTAPSTSAGEANTANAPFLEEVQAAMAYYKM